MPLRGRPDGTPVPDVHPLRRIMPVSMPTRTECCVLFEQQIALAPAREALTHLNDGTPPARAVTLFHLVLFGIGRVLHDFPRLNRFVMGSRLWARRGIWLSFSGKKRLDAEAPLFTAKLEWRPAEPIRGFVDRIHAALRENRSDRPTATEREVRGFLHVPAPLLRIGTHLIRRLDALNLLPPSFVLGDPLYASAFVANLGSVGLDAAFHHNYEYGTIPIFVTVGRTHRAVVVHDDGTVGTREVMVLRYTYDERVEDGFYAARALEQLKAYLEAPASLVG